MDLAAKSKNPAGDVDLDTMDPAVSISIHLHLPRLQHSDSALDSGTRPPKTSSYWAFDIGDYLLQFQHSPALPIRHQNGTFLQR